MNDNYDIPNDLQLPVHHRIPLFASTAAAGLLPATEPDGATGHAPAIVVRATQPEAGIAEFAVFLQMAEIRSLIGQLQAIVDLDQSLN